MSSGLRGVLSSASVRHQSMDGKAKLVRTRPVAPRQERKLLLFIEQLIDLPLMADASSPEEFRVQGLSDSSAVIGHQGPRIRTCHRH